MADVTRTFVAVPLPEGLSPRVAKLQESLDADVPGVRWEVPTPLHVTLAFLGDVPHAALVGVCRAVNEASQTFEPIEVSLQGIGVFPNLERPRVVWAGLTGPGVDRLMALQAAIAAAVAREGFPGESQPFHPHATIGRFKTARRGSGRSSPRGPSPTPPANLERILDRRRRWTAGPFRIPEVVTFSSQLTPDGPVYAPLARSRLAARPARLGASDRPPPNPRRPLDEPPDALVK